MAAEIDDGGAAFPIPLDGRPGAYGPEFGMTLRDWLAGHEKAPADLSIGYAEVLAGRPHPHKSETLGPANADATIETIRFWADAEARYRYIVADAMLAARKAGDR